MSSGSGSKNVPTSSSGNKVQTMKLESGAASGSNQAVKIEPSTEPIQNGQVRAEEEDVNAEDVKINVMSPIQEIFKIAFRDSQDPAQRNKDALEVSENIWELDNAFTATRDQIHKLPGVERSKPGQLEYLEVLKKQLEATKKLITKYKNLNLKVGGFTGQKPFGALDNQSTNGAPSEETQEMNLSEQPEEEIIPVEDIKPDISTPEGPTEDMDLDL